MIQNVVYATDLSEPSEAGITSDTCIECLRRVGVERFYLMNVIDVSMRSGIAPFDLETPHKERLEEERKILEDEGFEVEARVVRGTPYRRINDLAEEVDADLVIVGSKGKHGWYRRTFVGSTTTNMSRTTVRPLLIERIVERDEEPRVAEERLFSRVLYATDFSENADRAYNEFQEIHPSLQEVTLLHVIAGEQKRMGEKESEAVERLREMADNLREMGVDEVNISVRYGDAAEEVLAEEEDVDPSLILMGSRGISRIRRLLLGSVTEEVVKKSDSNILIVPDRGKKPQRPGKPA